MNDNFRRVLEANGCWASDWSRVHIDPESDVSLIRNVEFEGDVEIGVLSRNHGPKCGIRDALIANSKIGSGVSIRHIHGGIHNAIIEDGVEITNCASITYSRESRLGVGTRVCVLDETGSREVIIYPGLSSQMAMLMARCRRSDAQRIRDDIDARIEKGELKVEPGIGRNSILRNCGPIEDVSVGDNIIIESVRRLKDGAFINNSLSELPTLMSGPGCDAIGFIVEDGLIDSGALIRNCYVGQGSHLEKGVTAHDSLFFANCSMENGEACALFAGPYSVSMHKGTLLIGCQTSFLNAGSNTNESNHMYKLGPIHWGVLERGVKTSSGSYLMLGACIGAFSLLMGAHKTHPDSREFPFSYLFGDPQGATVVVPGIMLRSCGLLRDEQKWPARDRRREIPADKQYDAVICDVLNPCTVDAMISALEIIRPMLNKPADDDRYHRYKGMKLSRASLERAEKLYNLGIKKYLSRFIADEEFFNLLDALYPDAEHHSGENPDNLKWVDLAGLPMPRTKLDDILKQPSTTQMQQLFRATAKEYNSLQLEWIARRFPPNLRVSNEQILIGASEFDRLVELDRATYREELEAESSMLKL